LIIGAANDSQVVSLALQRRLSGLILMRWFISISPKKVLLHSLTDLPHRHCAYLQSARHRTHWTMAYTRHFKIPRPAVSFWRHGSPPTEKPYGPANSFFIPDMLSNYQRGAVTSCRGKINYPTSNVPEFFCANIMIYVFF